VTTIRPETDDQALDRSPFTRYFDGVGFVVEANLQLLRRQQHIRATRAARARAEREAQDYRRVLLDKAAALKSYAATLPQRLPTVSPALPPIEATPSERSSAGLARLVQDASRERYIRHLQLQVLDHADAIAKQARAVEPAPVHGAAPDWDRVPRHTVLGYTQPRMDRLRFVEEVFARAA
jgi:hypothetical protein